ncbi:uncharacterized protein TRAVEDRAFT_42881 [Trametes versicolor FP-101664 SS1]|uniref:uncharacterized protein n=1 Tax=Trametes versicolor (strain FP-101664) TaxID=717944 RepID=UPI000462130D|nr:uncharacterized protein TRAVEDRAFT_42881 [Trametes versicolor FP-101664 SS1]EIW62521.1 hypothetical protein TRAVEDRAFT_42881 [Trametes versicolor FP-101664 SS1]
MKRSFVVAPLALSLAGLPAVANAGFIEHGLCQGVCYVATFVCYNTAASGFSTICGIRDPSPAQVRAGCDAVLDHCSTGCTAFTLRFRSGSQSWVPVGTAFDLVQRVYSLKSDL